MLKWLSHQTTAVKRRQIFSYVKTEITEMGGTERTILNYVKECVRYALIEDTKNGFKITNYGRKWLERHSH